MPQPGAGGLVWAQVQDEIFNVDAHGVISEFGKGFDPQPQTDGPGLCWRDTPAFSTDWWTGSTGLGSMMIRCPYGKRGDRLKILYWDRDGYALWYKRLEAGTFRFPANEGDAKEIAAADLALVLEGVDLASVKRQKRFSLTRPA